MIKDPNAIDFPLVYILVFLTVFWPCPVNESYVDDTLLFTIYWWILKKTFIEWIYWCHDIDIFLTPRYLSEMSRALLNWLWLTKCQLCWFWYLLCFMGIKMTEWLRIGQRALRDIKCQFFLLKERNISKKKEKKIINGERVLKSVFLTPNSCFWLDFRSDCWQQFAAKVKTRVRIWFVST